MERAWNKAKLSERKYNDEIKLVRTYTGMDNTRFFLCFS